ncbi:radical SAM protein [Thermodesulfobacteriota bacterium]
MRPKLLFATDDGTIYDHPYLEMVGCSGRSLQRPDPRDLVQLPGLSRLYYHLGCPPYGYDPRKKKIVPLRETRIGREKVACHAVSAFIQQGWVRLLLPAMDYSRKQQQLPMWAYSTVGFAEESYFVPAYQIDDNDRWNPDHFDDRTLPPEVARRHAEFPENRLLEHLERCAVHYHCFAAKNFFYRRWEAPIPTSPACNSGCLGCISQQPGEGCLAPQERISFVPGLQEITAPFVRHLNEADAPIVSFGQGCEGEPLLQSDRISEAVAAIRAETAAGTINLNSNGSVPDRVDSICASGLESIRISINSARPELYNRYYRPRGYRFEDVLESIGLACRRGVFTMINYLIFPGISDRQEEYEALCAVIEKTRPNLIHFKNLNIDPDFYLDAMQAPDTPGMGLQEMQQRLGRKFPELQFGYFNRTRDAFFPEK